MDPQVLRRARLLPLRARHPRLLRAIPLNLQQVPPHPRRARSGIESCVQKTDSQAWPRLRFSSSLCKFYDLIARRTGPAACSGLAIFDSCTADSMYVCEESFGFKKVLCTLASASRPMRSGAIAVNARTRRPFKRSSKTLCEEVPALHLRCPPLLPSSPPSFSQVVSLVRLGDSLSLRPDPKKHRGETTTRLDRHTD